MTTATAPTPTDSAPVGEPSDAIAADAPTSASKDGETGTLLTKQATQESETPAITLALPKDSPLNPDVLPRITDLAQKAGVTDPASAQALVDLLHGEVVATTETLRSALTKGGSEWNAMVSKMEADALADPVLGANDPAKLMQVVSEAKQVIGKFAPDGFSEYLDETGLGSDPRFLKFTRAVYAGMREDTLVRGNPPAPKPKTAAQRMYPNMPSVDG